MKQQFKYLLIGVIAASLFGVLQFVICSIVAMLRFPGGYSFSENYLTELGMMGHPTHQLFNGSLIFLGLSLLPAFTVLWLTDQRGSVGIRAAAIFGWISSLGAIAMACFTADRALVAHYIAMAFWLFPMIYMAVSFFFGASHSPYVGMGFLVASLTMVIVMLVVLLNTTSSSIQLLQKTVVICGMVWLIFVIAYLIQSGMQIYENWVEDDGSRQRKEQSYFARMGSGQHRRD